MIAAGVFSQNREPVMSSTHEHRHRHTRIEKGAGDREEPKPEAGSSEGLRDRGTVSPVSWIFAPVDFNESCWYEEKRGLAKTIQLRLMMMLTIHV